MSTKTDRFADTISSIASPIILDYVRENGPEFGIISLLKTEVSKDHSYADLFIASSNQEEKLPKFLSGIAPKIRREIGKNIDTYKIPTIRFKRMKNTEAEKTVYDLINELSNQYALHEEN